MSESNEPEIVQLVEEKDYLAADGQVVKLDTGYVYWVNGSRKIEQAPWHVAVVDKIPSQNVRVIHYQKKFSVPGATAGLGLIAGSVGAVIGMVFSNIYNLWLVCAAPIGLLLGLAFIFGIRRRMLRFTYTKQDIDWISGPLEYKAAGFTVLRVKRWADQHHIATEKFPTAIEIVKLR